ncbi:hypothetical protein RB595_000739 [Gaeumannomyces hyphopodioides]
MSRPADSFASSKPLRTFTPPSSILVVGAGVFGLGTAFALARRHVFSSCSITVLDRSTNPAVFPSRDASSVDSSRIIRADYADPAYAALAAEAQVEWRKAGEDQLGGQGRYSESGLVVVADRDPTLPQPGSTPRLQATTHKTGADYCRSSWENVVAMSEHDQAMKDKIQLLPTQDDIRQAIGTGGVSGVWGYINRASGWADADQSMRWLLRHAKDSRRINFVSGTASSLTREGSKITGVALDDGRAMSADLVILATGAWTGGLIDLRGRAVATAQTLAYVNITDEEQAVLAAQPVILNLSSGLFVIPPRNNVLKVARHEYGYLNPTTTAEPLCSPSDSWSEDVAASCPISLPPKNVEDAFQEIPERSKAVLRNALKDMIPLPAIHDRPFATTKICWYNDTPTGDFIVDYHPDWDGLFIATGGSGHGFKFLPVLGERIVDCVVGERPQAFKTKWAFQPPTSSTTTAWNAVSTQDGSRAGETGLLFSDEMAKAS